MSASAEDDRPSGDRDDEPSSDQDNALSGEEDDGSQSEEEDDAGPRADLLEKLEAIQCPGSFFWNANFRDEIDPGLDVAGIGRFGMPLYERDVHSLIALSHQAPFGKGEHTIVDESFRDTWELNGNQLRMLHPKWPGHLKHMVSTVCTELGVPGGGDAVYAHLYKLLVYDQGAKFQPHKDSEKAPGQQQVSIC